MEKMIELDCVLVPLGLLLMFGYHFWLFYRIMRDPTRTVIGINSINRRIWVRTMMEDTSKNGVLAIQTLRNSIMASTLMSSTAIMLSSLIAVLMTNTNTHKSESSFVLGHGPTDALHSAKYFSILVCFLLAFLLSAQSVRYYSHANILINVPHAAKSRASAVEYVTRAMNRGSYFWSLGLRAYYFSFPMFLWVFGPVPMFACCVVMVVMLYFLDLYSGWGSEGEDEEEEWEINGGDQC